jgi:hypothetical protein
MRLTAILLVALGVVAASSSPVITVDVGPDASYNISVDGTVWLSSTKDLQLCVGGTTVSLAVASIQAVSGSDKFGPWTGTAVGLTASSVNATYTFKTYADSPSLAVLTATFPSGVDTSGCGSNTAVSTHFPSFDTSAAAAPSLTWVSWKGSTLPAHAGTGLGTLSANALDVGPAVLSDGSPQSRTLILSTLVRGGCRRCCWHGRAPCSHGSLMSRLLPPYFL